MMLDAARACKRARQIKRNIVIKDTTEIIILRKGDRNEHARDNQEANTILKLCLPILS